MEYVSHPRVQVYEMYFIHLSQVYKIHSINLYSGIEYPKTILSLYTPVTGVYFVIYTPEAGV